LDAETGLTCDLYPTPVTEWLANTDEANIVSSSQEVPLALELEEETFKVEVV